MRRVVITGMGAVTPLGHTIDEYWDGLKNGRSGIRVLEEYKEKGFPSHIGGSIQNLETGSLFTPMELKRFDKFIVYGLAAASYAWDHSGLDKDKIDPKRTGALVGSGIGGLNIFMEQHEKYLEKGYKAVSPFFIPMLISNMLSGQIANRYGLMGPNFCIASACATSNHSVGTAYRFIQHGEVDIVFAGGAEGAITGMGLSGFINMKAVSRRNDAPEKASRPFDKDRDGFVMADGAGVVILEELEHAKKRGARIYAEVIGMGMSDDAYHMAAPHPEGSGALLAMQIAMKDAKVNPEDIDYVNMHGTSTPVGDIAETKAIHKAFGESAKKLTVSSTKSMVGHMLGAAGGVELIATMKTMEESLIAPTINVENQDPECDLDVVPNVAREKNVDIAMSNSFGFGGHNGVIIVKKYKD